MTHKRIVPLFSTILFVGALCTPAFAQYDAYPHHRDRVDSYSQDSAAARWNRFLEQNPDFARRYRANPNIIRDPRVMDHQPGVREFFANNPDARQYAYNSARMDQATEPPAVKWHEFLEQNPNFAERYRQNPGIIDDENVMNDEPEVRELLRTNPGIRAYLRNRADYRGPDRAGYNSMRDEDLNMNSDRNMNIDAYLADHPNIAKRLREDPSLVNDGNFARNHPHLHEYLRSHPDALR